MAASAWRARASSSRSIPATPAAPTVPASALPARAWRGGRTRAVRVGGEVTALCYGCAHGGMAGRRQPHPATGTPRGCHERCVGAERSGARRHAPCMPDPGRAGEGAPEFGAAEHDGAGCVAPARQQRLPLRAHRVAEPQQLPGEPAAGGGVTERLSVPVRCLCRRIGVTVMVPAWRFRHVSLQPQPSVVLARKSAGRQGGLAARCKRPCPWSSPSSDSGSAPPYESERRAVGPARRPGARHWGGSPVASSPAGGRGGRRGLCAGRCRIKRGVGGRQPLKALQLGSEVHVDDALQLRLARQAPHELLANPHPVQIPVGLDKG